MSSLETQDWISINKKLHADVRILVDSRQRLNTDMETVTRDMRRRRRGANPGWPSSKPKALAGRRTP
jgi:head-tail adaptor